MGWLCPIHAKPDKQVRVVNDTEADGDESLAVLGHVSGFLVPVVAPSLLLVLNWTRTRLVRAHLAVSVMVSAAWLLAAIAVISVDSGHVSIDEQETSTAGLVGLLAVAAAVVLLIVMNIQRVRRRQLPLGWPRSD